MTAELVRARDTLCRGADVFARWLDAPGHQSPEAHLLRSKVIGNGLRELDRFLNLLIDETARSHGAPAFPNQRNTAHKLRRLHGMPAIADDDSDRLIALGRSRCSLFYCQGIARHRDADDPVMMTLGWPVRPGAGQPLRRVPLGSRLTLGPGDFESVSLFYGRLAKVLAAKT